MINPAPQQQRVVYVSQPVDEKSAKQTVTELLAFDRDRLGGPIQMVISSPGGALYASFAILETMKGLHVPIHTFGSQMVAGAALLLMIAGEKGKRFLGPSTRVCIAPIWNAWNGAPPPARQAPESERQRRRILDYFAQYAALPEQTYDQVQHAWLTPAQAVQMGLADYILETDLR